MRYVPQTARRHILYLCLSFIAAFFSNPFNGFASNNKDATPILMEVVCPEPNGGSFNCIDDVPAAANDSLSFVSLPGASIPNSSSAVIISSQDIISTNSGCNGDPITITRVYSISNGDMDEEFCTRTFTVEQSQDLELTCSNIVVYIDENGLAEIQPEALISSVEGVCPGGLIDTILSNNQFDCDDVNNSVPVVLSVTDNCGNQASCTPIVFVADTISPTIECPQDINILVGPCVCESAVFFDAPEIDDNCPQSLILSRTDGTGLNSGDSFPVGTTTISYSVQDAYGNTATCSFDVNVETSDPGPITCIDSINYSLDENCTGLVTVEMVISDEHACDLSAYTVTVYDENGVLIPDNEINETHLWTSVTAVLSYACFNNSCETILNIEDKMAPIIECVDDTLSCSEMIVFPAPNVIENCGPVTMTLLNETIEDVSCTDPEIQKIITRVYQASDSYGNSSVCTQTLSVQKLNMDEIAGPGPDTLLYCGSGFATDQNGNPDPDVTGAPSLSGVSLWPDPYLVCNLVVTYEDILLFDTGCMRKIVRQWTAYSWYCGDDDMRIFNQQITVQDTVAPFFVCPENFEVNTPVLSCLAEVGLPFPDIEDACENGIELDIVYPGGFIDDAGEEETIELPIGTHLIQYTVYDDCLNSSSCSFEVTVVDHVQPIAICESQIVVALGGDGTAVLNADMIDNGSFDECSDISLLIARMEEACGNEADTEFGESIQVCCEDLDGDIMVAIQVMDGSGNTNQCMVAVTVIDSLQPEILSILPDISVSCDFPFDPSNLNVFGEIVTEPVDQDTIIITADSIEFTGPAYDGLVMDNCTMTIVESLSEINIDNCGQGYIIRTFSLTDMEGNTLETEQRIDFINYFPFDPETIVWPEDVLIENDCNPSLLPEDLPEGSQEPEYQEDFCDQVARTFTDDTIYYASPGCLDIQRNWFVADWCQNNGGQFLMVSDTQYISVRDNVSPIITNGCTAPDVFCSFSPDCGGLFVPLIASATDNCNAALALLWNFEIDIDNNGSIDTFGIGNDASDIYPVGTHHIYWTVTDLCGNGSSCNYVFEIEHCGLPTPVCEVGEVFYLEPVDEDGDGEFDNEIVIITPEDIDGGSFDACGSPLVLSFSSDTTDQLRIFDCQNIPEVELSLYVMDEDGNQDYCTTFILLADTNDIEICSSNLVSINGNLNTLGNKGLVQAEIELEGSGLSEWSDEDGHYAFPEMSAGKNYVLKPAKNDDATNGVTTLDLVLIQRHILGIQKLVDPYLLIAADINKSGTISASDILELQKLILGQIESFSNNTSWRFIDQNYSFPDPNNPWFEEVPEGYTFDPLVSDMELNFKAIKVGDVNGTAKPDPFILEDISDRTGIELVREVSDPRVLMFNEGGELFATQFTLVTEEDGELMLDFSSSEGNWHSHKIGPGRFNVLFYSATPIRFERGEVFLYSNLAIESIASDGLPPQLITGSMEVLPLEILVRDTKDRFNAYLNNVPNPWSSESYIRYNTDKSGEVLLNFYDTSGKLVKSVTKDVNKGDHVFRVGSCDFEESGVIIYELITDGQRITNRMILLDH